MKESKLENAKRRVTYEGKLALYHELIKDFRLKAMKLEVMMAFNEYEIAADKQSTVVYLTKEAEQVLDDNFIDMFFIGDTWLKEWNDLAHPIHERIKEGFGAYRASGYKLFGRVIVWDALHIMAGNEGSIPCA